MINKLPRKLKKNLKKKYKNRYGYSWLTCYDKSRLIVEYYWFYKNPFNWNMNEKLYLK